MTRKATRLIYRILLLVLASSSLAATTQSTAHQSPNAPLVLSGKYSDLHPEQKRLVDDWFRRFSETVKKHVSPEEGYDQLPLSDRTTFSAITHALLRTPLTDSSGASLGESAITLIGHIDEVSGKVEGAGGDEQFRIYVSLKPDALEILGKSTEFSRSADNTVYHKGYPISFRSNSGSAPSIQVSVTRDGKRADIDVDYRSSKFPISLINGHLSASNSDIRAGNNDERHNNRWEGMSNWWRSLLGLPLAEKKPTAATEILASTPRTKDSARPATAVHDFLHAWLVEQKPENAVADFTDTALSCMELEQGRPLDRGVARFAMLMGLRQLNEQIGKVKDLSEVVAAAFITDPRAKVIEQPYKNQFSLYDFREDLAEEFNCGNRLDPSQMSARAASSKTFGKYFGAVFYLKSQAQRGETVVTLWAKENRYWRLISYHTEPERDPARSAIVAGTPVNAPALPYYPGDENLISTARDFFQKWFLRHQIEEAAQYLSPRSLACADIYRGDDVPEPGTPEEAGELIRAGMDRMADAAGLVTKLDAAIVAPQISHPDLKLVQHADSSAFAIVALPDSMAAQADCSQMKRGEELSASVTDAATKNYGQYYATGFRMAKALEQPAVLWIIWGREGDQWKIVAYHILAP